MNYRINYTANGEKDSDSDTLRHWKYTKRERKGGKWRYWYATDGSNNRMGQITDAGNRLVRNAPVITPHSKDLFDTKTTVESKDDRGDTVVDKTETEKGEITKAIERGKDFVSRMFDTKATITDVRTGASITKTQKGEISKAIDKFLGRTSKSNTKIGGRKPR